MLKILFVNLLLVLSLFAQSEVVTLLGGGGTGTNGSGNIDGVGSSAAIYTPKVITKSADNQLLIGDWYGLKKFNPATNSITTLNSVNFNLAYFYDIKVDSVGNIYTSARYWVDDPQSCNDTIYTFSDVRIQKFSPTGTLLQTWSNACTDADDEYTDSLLYLAIDASDNVYMAPHITPSYAPDWIEKSNIYKLNSDGTMSVFIDLKTINEEFDSITAMKYNNGYIYISSGVMFSANNYFRGIHRLNLATKELEYYFKVSECCSSTARNMIFSNNELLYFSTPYAIQKVFQSNGELKSAYVIGQDSSGTPREPAYKAFDPELLEGIDGLYLNNYANLSSVAQVGNDLYFLSEDGARVLRATFPSNEAPTLKTVDFPTQITKNAYNYLKFNAEDSDGFAARVVCDFGDGEGKQEIYGNVYNDYLHDSIIKMVTYTEDGNYNIQCTTYDNEGLSSEFSKSVQVGDGSTTTCPTFSLEKNEQQISLKVGDLNYLNITVCDPVTIQSSDESVVVATRSKGEYVDEVELKAISDGTATVTVSDKNGEGHLYITVGDGTPTPITTPDTKQDIGNITFLEYEPDGYFSWSEADKFCKERGYRLPTMEELIYVWNFNGGTISPEGFEKDTFYWADSKSDFYEDSYQACAMDADCSQEGAWPADSNGHPKCVVSVNGPLDIPTDNPDEPTTPIVVEKANYNDFRVEYCGTYVSTEDGIKVSGTSYRYGNNLKSVQVYDVRDSVTLMKWKADSAEYSGFTPSIMNITGGFMTTNHSFAGSSKIESNTWYYTTMTVSGNKATTITAKNAYATSGDDVVDSREHELTDQQLALSRNGVPIGFTMGDTYASTSASFTLSEFATTAKVVAKSVAKEIEFTGAPSEQFSSVVGAWSFQGNQLTITDAKLNDKVVLDVSNISGVTFKAKSNQSQSNFLVRTFDAEGNTISAVTVDPSSSECLKEYYLPASKDVTQVEFLFTTLYAIEQYESQTKNITIENLQVQYGIYEAPSTIETDYEVKGFVVVDNGDAKEVEVDMGDKKPVITVPPASEVFTNNDGGVTTVTPPSINTQVITTVNKNGTVMSEIEKLLAEIQERTRVLVDLVVESAQVNNDGSSAIRAVYGNFTLHLTADASAEVTPNYSIGDKEVSMPTFSSGSSVHVATESDAVIIEVKTKLTSKIVFQR